MPASRKRKRQLAQALASRYAKQKHSLKDNLSVPFSQILFRTMADHDDWEPLSETDRKLMRAQRERSDRISKLMGDYLLKGYKMLATTCHLCQTILLQDRQGTDYCVACQELDSDVGKDDPVINQSAAISMAREIELASAGAAAGTTTTTPTTSAQKSIPQSSETVTALSMTSIDVQSWPPNPADLKSPSSNPAKQEAPDPDSGIDSSSSFTVQQASSSSGKLFPQSPSPLNSLTRNALSAKIDWARQELIQTQSVEYSIQLCQLIKSAAEAIVTLRSADL